MDIEKIREVKKLIIKTNKLAEGLNDKEREELEKFVDMIQEKEETIIE